MMRVLLLALSVVSFAACPGPVTVSDAGAGGDSGVETDAGPTLPHFTIKVFATGQSSVELHWFDGTSWAAGPVPLQNDGAWWTGTFAGSVSDTTSPQFSLKANGDWYPGGTTSYHPMPGTVWLKDGLLFPYDPTGARPTDQLAVLTVNLHTYQEADALAALNQVAEVIAKGEVDLVAFQECAQRRDTGIVDFHYGANIRTDNMAKLIVTQLADHWGKAYTWVWDWSHYGFTSYEEGSAVLGRGNFTFLDHETRYISTSSDKNDINSRTAIYGAWEVPNLGRVHVFSTHVSWGGPQPAQLGALTRFADEKSDAGQVLTLLSGDYNLNYLSDGYQQMVSDGGWVDAFRQAAPSGATEPTLNNDRIDYQFRAASSRLEPMLAQRVFLQLTAPEAANQRVSDHVGVIVRYRVKP